MQLHRHPIHGDGVVSAASDIARRKKAIQALIDHGSTPGERAAASPALERLENGLRSVLEPDIDQVPFPKHPGGFAHAPHFYDAAKRAAAREAHDQAAMRAARSEVLERAEAVWIAEHNRLLTEAQCDLVLNPDRCAP